MRALAVLAVCAGLWGMAVPTALAQPKPSDFFMEELTLGLLGGFIGGPTLELVYVTTLCREAPSPELCQGLGVAAMQFVIYTFTLPAGASAGIIIAGAWHGIVSDPIDWILTYTFAMIGSWTGWLNAAGILTVTDFLILNFHWSLTEKDKAGIYTFTRVVLPIFYAALFGTLGYNTIAHPASPPSGFAPTWRLPIFSVRF